MADLAEMTEGTRSFLRDFPIYFEAEQGPLNVLTVRLPHPFVAASSLQVYLSTEDMNTTPPTLATVLTDEWQVDDRNGLLKMTNSADLGKRCLIAGYHYKWFSDSDIERHLRNVLAEHAYTRSPDWGLGDVNGVEIEVVQIGAVVRALWSLALELSLDIDVSTPEGMFIPAHQRYAQVVQTMQYWEAQYLSRAASLNVGLGALEIFRLRRVAYTTGRYVPVYKEREVDDHNPPERLYPPIPAGLPPVGFGERIRTTASEFSTVESWTETPTGPTSTGAATHKKHTPSEIMRENEDLGFGGWRPLGTSG